MCSKRHCLFSLSNFNVNGIKSYVQYKTSAHSTPGSVSSLHRITTDSNLMCLHIINMNCNWMSERREMGYYFPSTFGPSCFFFRHSTFVFPYRFFLAHLVKTFHAVISELLFIDHTVLNPHFWIKLSEPLSDKWYIEGAVRIF